jgi:hypothetical protein
MILSKKGSLVLLALIVTFLVIAFAFAINKFIFEKDFTLYIKAHCDPQIESCFVHQCEDWDVRCANESDQKFLYKIVIKNQKQMNECFGHNCPEIKCLEGEFDCEIYLCSEENIQLFELDDTCSASI